MLKDRLKDYAPVELYASEAYNFLLVVRGTKQKDLGFDVTTLSALLRRKLNWNVRYITVVSEAFKLEPDQFLQVGRVLYKGLHPRPSPDDLAGTKPGSLERFARLYDRAALGTWLPKVYDAQAASAWSPPAFTAYQKGKLDDDAMYAALVDMARRLVENPAMTGEEIAKAFGQLRD